jgi:hypothetical protein
MNALSRSGQTQQRCTPPRPPLHTNGLYRRGARRDWRFSAAARCPRTLKMCAYQHALAGVAGQRSDGHVGQPRLHAAGVRIRALLDLAPAARAAAPLGARRLPACCALRLSPRCAAVTARSGCRGPACGCRRAARPERRRPPIPISPIFGAAPLQLVARSRFSCASYLCRVSRAKRQERGDAQAASTQASSHACSSVHAGRDAAASGAQGLPPTRRARAALGEDPEFRFRV